ncbi:MAG: hypothetical protein A3F18_08655 [Legionellales bacterium RIFCSPHIGHO2_12_FULL_37_14]|nr:MAG: hypothetical protein A3F18_08655 [Legionellales bacterium RIFCSPHIGHO2_12_FULL_37_14]
MTFHVIIPARFASKRLKNKLLQDLGGISILERTYQRAVLAKPLSITIATESEVIKDLALSFGANVMLTSGEHNSGTARICEVVERLDFPPDTIVVNLQADEPFMPSDFITKVAAKLDSSSAEVATLVAPVKTLADFLSPSIVKVVLSAQDEALYFSRSPIPYCRDNPTYFQNSWRHFGIYAYRASFLRQFPNLTPSFIEDIESLEQLRVIWHGYKIAVAKVEDRIGLEINTQEELDEARSLLESM